MVWCISISFTTKVLTVSFWTSVTALGSNCLRKTAPLILSLFLVHSDRPGHRILWSCPFFSLYFVLHSRHCLLLCIYMIPIVMGLVSIGDPKYYSSTNTESHHIYKFTLCYQDHLSCLVSEGCFKKCGRSVCENIGASRWPVKGEKMYCC